MKKTILPILALVPVLMLASCNEDSRTTTVSKSILGNSTIVSSLGAGGSFTRTAYGKDFFGNQTIDVSRRHQCATQQGDLALLCIELAGRLVMELMSK